MARLDKKGLFVTDEGNHILLEFDDKGQLISSKEISEKFREKELEYSLNEIQDKFLNLSEDVFSYLVPWVWSLKEY